MATTDAVRDLMNETAWQQAQAAKAEREASYETNGRNVGGTMGKDDFLLLLSTQLRYQNPLEPTTDSDFASQLAQFSSLETMQNMSASLLAMSNYQSYGLVGKYVLAKAEVDGAMTDIPGIVDSVFTKDGVTYAQIGEYAVPVGSITDVFNSSNMLTPESFIQASSGLIGRKVQAQTENGVVAGTVTRVTVDNGSIYAYIDDGTGEAKKVPAGSIFDISVAESPAEAETAPEEIETKETAAEQPAAEQIEP